MRTPLIAASFLAVAISACNTEPPKRAKEPQLDVPKDDWAGIAHTAEWIYVTRDFGGTRKAECEAVLEWVKGEEPCNATLCVHGRDLAREWTERCTKLVPEAAGDVRRLEKSYASKMGQPATDCETEASAVLRDGCGADRSCLRTAERWAARCAKPEATPLVLRLLERAVERRLAEPRRVTLEARTCDDLLGDLAKAATCAQRFQCEDALKVVETYRSRCESQDSPPPTRAAVLELSVMGGAEQPAPTIVAAWDSPKLAAGDVPLALADGTGAIVSVCGERVLDLEKYVAARQACESGKIVVARGFKTKNKTVEVRMVPIDFHSDAGFHARFPSIVAAGEREARDKGDLARFVAAIESAGKQASEGASGAKAAAATLAGTIAAHASALARSQTFRAALTGREEELAPALAQIGKAKAAAARKLKGSELSAFAQRGASYAFSDVRPDGGSEALAGGRGATLDTTELLPKAMVAYRAAFKPVETMARGRKADAKALLAAKVRAGEDAAMCGVSEKKLDTAEKALLACAFGAERCDAERMAELAKAIDESKVAAERSHHEVTLAIEGAPPEAKDELTQSAAASGCLEPWW